MPIFLRLFAFFFKIHLFSSFEAILTGFLRESQKNTIFHKNSKTFCDSCRYSYCDQSLLRRALVIYYKYVQCVCRFTKTSIKLVENAEELHLHLNGGNVVSGRATKARSAGFPFKKICHAAVLIKLADVGMSSEEYPPLILCGCELVGKSLGNFFSLVTVFVKLVVTPKRVRTSGIAKCKFVGGDKNINEIY